MSIRAEYRYETGAELCQTLALTIAEDLRVAITQRGTASLALSGGRTPIPLFEALSNMELDWSKVVVTLVDDRWVDATHPDSNEALVRAHLLARQAESARFISLKTEHATPAEGLSALELRLAALTLPLDVAILGMGDDGHCASWFPLAPQLETALKPPTGQNLAWTDPVTAPHQRITMTLPVIEAARHVILHIAGANKLPVIELAKQPGPLNEMPIRHVIHSDKVALDVYWSK